MSASSPSTSPRTNRREFLASTAAASLLLVPASTAFEATANSRVTWGLIGCGGRGKWIANLFQKHGGYELRAVHDYFE
jgi:hypothetical protein